MEETADQQNSGNRIFTLSAASPIIIEKRKGTRRKSTHAYFICHLHIYAFLRIENGTYFIYEESSCIWFDLASFSFVHGFSWSWWRPVQNTGCFSFCKPSWHKKSLQENGKKLVNSPGELHFNTVFCCCCFPGGIAASSICTSQLML